MKQMNMATSSIQKRNTREKKASGAMTMPVSAVDTSEASWMIHSAEEFIRLRESDDPEIYRRSADEAAPVEVWCEVLDTYPDMAKWVAHNKTIPVEIIERLASSGDVDVRITIAMKRGCPPHVMERLASDPEPTVRLRIAYNAKASRALLGRLLHDPWEHVVEVARRRLGSSAAESGQK